MDYFISMNGRIAEDRRPAGFPKMVSDVFSARAENIGEVIQILNAKASEITRAGGMTVTLDKEYRDSLLTDSEKKSIKELGNGIFVPLQMISFLGFEVRRLVGLVPTGEEGEPKPS